jgi:hypothetical protein
MGFRLSKKVLLEEGDRIRVSGGPYFLTQAGKKISMGERGTGVFVSAEENGEAIYVKFDKTSAARFVYIGSERISESTGTTLKAHKIVKLRK